MQKLNTFLVRINKTLLCHTGYVLLSVVLVVLMGGGGGGQNNNCF
jgi:hypothetical protein